MRSDLFQTEFSKPVIAPPGDEATKSLVYFAATAFGNSEWLALRGGKKPYYFNLDKAYSQADRKLTAKFHSSLASFIRRVWNGQKDAWNNADPILAYVCPSGAPVGIVQARGALTQLLGWQSVVVFPDKRLLRSRVIAGELADKYPGSIRWIAGRPSILLADAVTTGESIARAVGAIRVFGCEPVSATAIYNREEGADESLATIRIPLYSLLTRSVVKDREYIDEKTRAAIRAGGRKIVRDLSVYVSAAG